MTLSNYLKTLLTNLVDTYKKNFLRTMGTIFVYTIICFLVVAVLLRFSNFDHSSIKKQVSLLSYFLTFYSAGETYSIVDLTNIVFLFFVSLFSISLIRSNADEKVEFKISKSFTSIRLNDFFTFIIVLLGCSLIDFPLFQSDRFLSTNIDNKGLIKWTHNLLMYLLREFIPWILFALTIYKTTNNVKLNMNFKKILFLFITFWIINMFTYDFSIFLRSYLFDFVLIPLDIDKKFLFESILGIGLVGFNFTGYYAVMTNSVILIEN